MEKTLLAQFLAQDCTPDVQRLLEEAIADEAIGWPHFELNRFDVSVERSRQVVVLEDVLDDTDAGTQVVPLPDFMQALSGRTARAGS
jgi:hypothetical protein